MKIVKFLILLFILLIAINPLKLYYEAKEPSSYQQEIFFSDSEKNLNMKNFKEIRRTFFRQKTYIVTYEYKQEILGNDKIKKIMISKFKKIIGGFIKNIKAQEETIRMA